MANLAILNTELGNLDIATRWLEQCRAINQLLGNVARAVATLNNLGTVHLLADAVASHREALRMYRELGELDEAAELFERKLATIKASGEHHGGSGARTIRLAETHRQLHRPEDASEHAGRALAKARALRNARLEAEALLVTALTELALGRTGDALRNARQALARCHECGLALVALGVGVPVPGTGHIGRCNGYVSGPT